MTTSVAARVGPSLAGWRTVTVALSCALAIGGIREAESRASGCGSPRWWNVACGDMQKMVRAIEELLVTGENPDPGVQLNLRDFSQAPASQMIQTIIEAMTAARRFRCRRMFCLFMARCPANQHQN